MKSRNRTITKDFILVVGVIVIGKILGFVRELIIAYFYGSSIETDSFYYVNSLITAIFTIITMGLGQAFTPMYLDKYIKNGKDAASHFADKIVTILLALGVIFGVLLFVYPDIWIKLLAPDMDQMTKSLSIKMLQIMSLCIPLYILFAIRKCILNSHKKYIVTEASGIPYSVAISFFTLILYSSMTNIALPLAAVVGVLLQYLFTFFFSKKDYLFKPRKISLYDPDIKEYFIMLIPIVGSAILEEANGLLRKSLASGMGEGAVANLSYCMTLVTLVNGIVIASISTVYFPYLINNYSEEDYVSFEKNASECITITSVIILPVVTFLLINAKTVVKIVYERGNFTSQDTAQVSSLFAIYIIGSIIYAYRCVIKTVFFSTKDAKTPMINEMYYLIICITCNLLQVRVFKMDLDALGIAWVISITVVTPLLFIKFRKKYSNISIIDKSTIIEFLKAVFSSIIIIILSKIINSYIIINNIFIKILLHGFLSVSVYLLSMIIIKSKTICEFLFLIIKKLKKEKL